MCTLLKLFGKACSCAFQVCMGWPSSCLVRISRNAFRHSHPFKNGKTCIRHRKNHNDIYILKGWGCFTRNWCVFFPVLLNSTPFQIWPLKMSFCEDWGTPLRQGGVKKKGMGLTSHRPGFVPCDYEPHYTASLRCSFLTLKLGPFCLTVFLRTWSIPRDSCHCLASGRPRLRDTLSPPCLFWKSTTIGTAALWVA